jgi:cobalt-zinc-cadmium efflux system protein
MGCNHDHSHDHDHDHGHGHSHGHVHHHGIGGSLRNAVLLTIAFVVGEAVAGWIGHSVALYSDAGHNLADALAMLFSWYAVRVSGKPSTSSRTFGYHRVGILAALINAASLVVIAALIAYEGVERLLHPDPNVHGGLMIVVAGAAVAINAFIAVGLHKHAKDDLNIRSAYLHMIGDAASSCAVIVAGILVSVTHNPIADPIVSFVIAAMILYSSWGILTESIGIFLEFSPANLDMDAVEVAIRHVDGVMDAHDLHVWTIGPGVVACSCHIVVAEQTISSGQQVLRAVVTRLREEFKINHTTVQVEVEGCDANDMYCTMRAAAEAAHHHH